MWILPKNYPLSSLYVQDMVESKEDLTLQELNIESSLMWRSKPSPLRTWLPRWKRVSWMPHLCGRILKPCQWSHFETELTSSLAVIPANLFQPQESDLEKKTPDTSGLTSATSSGQLDLFGVSLKMSKDTSVSDSEKSSATWKALVTKLRGEYSQRVKSAHLIRESESTLWPTVTTDSASSRTKKYAQGGMPLSMAVNSWATPNTMDHLPPRSEEATRKMQEGQRKGRKMPCNLREQVDEATMNLYQDQTPWPTPRVSSANGPSQSEIELGNPKKRLETEVIVREPAQWSTPTARDWKGKRGGAERGWAPDLNDQVAEREPAQWPTPLSSDYKNMDTSNQISLSASVKSWPTPTAQEAEKAGFHAKGQMGQSLSAMAKRGELSWPTPSTRDHKDNPGMAKTSINADGSIRNRTDQLARKVFSVGDTPPGGGHLNPDWVEWLMGVPTGWTELDSWETE